MTILPDALCMDFPTVKVSAVSVIREDGTYLAVVNTRCGANKQSKSAAHEAMHVVNGDFDKVNADAIEEAAHREGE